MKQIQTVKKIISDMKSFSYEDFIYVCNCMV